MNAVTFIDYNGETLALCCAPPNRAQAMKLTATLPGDVTRSLLATETRRRFATSNRYDFEYLCELTNAADANDLRMWLNRLKTETVAVPLWDDGVALAAACNEGATLLQITGEQPVRYGVEWIILSDDLQDFEIILVNNLTSTTATLASPGTDLSWPAGTMIYPLLFGRLAERPQVTAPYSDESFSATLKFHENSPFARKLNPRFVAQRLGGAHLDTFSLFKLWDIEPDFADPVGDWTESDILIRQIPPKIAREEQQYAQANWNRRGLEMTFTCTTRDQMAAIEYWFNERKGTSLPFFIPTFLGELRLAADVAAGAATFQIEPSRYEIASYDEKPSAAFLVFIDDDNVYPQRVTLVNGTTITPIIPVGEAHAAAETNVSFLLLVRFLDEELDWDLTVDGLARVRIKFIEVPDEYTQAAPSLPPPATLYKWEEGLPNGITNTWYFTSYEEQVVFGGNTYTPAPFTYGQIHKDLKLGDNMEITSWGGDFLDNPIGRYLPYTLNAALFCTVTRVNRDTPNDGNARQLFVGRVKAPVNMKGTDWKVTLRDPLDRLLDLKIPRMLFQPVDNWIQFTPPTQLTAADFAKTGTLKPQGGGVGALIGSLVVWLIGSTKASTYFAGGWITTGVGANYEQRSIYDSSLITPNKQELTLDRPLLKAVNSQAVTAYPGYDGTIDQCETKFANRKRHGGHAFMPDQNQVFQTGEIQTPVGGKKG